MKKTILSLLTFAALFASANLKADEGHIYEVAACTEIGGDISESAYPIWPMGSDECQNAGYPAYFRVRLASPDDSTGNNWDLIHLGTTSFDLDWALFPPQICIFVSGAERWATLVAINNVEINTFKFTDLVFKYTTRPGDFALPIVLGAKVGSTIVPALDPAVTMPEYCLDLKGKWAFEFKLSSTSAVSPNWWLTSARKPGVVPVQDSNLSNAGFNIQTVDFDTEWETNNVVWRSVHQDTTITVGALPKLLRKSAASEAVSLYVWSTNEEAVVVSGPNVEEVECDPVNHPGVKYHVAKVTIAASPSENATGSFTLKGVDQTANGGWSTLVLSPYKQFNSQNLVGEYYQDYVTVPIRCVDPLPPSVMVKVEDSIAYATSDYKTAATRIKVSLTQPIAEKFKVRLAPAFTEDNVALEPEVWGQYVRFSTSQNAVASLPDADPATTEVELGGGVDEVYVWLYALRGDDHTSGAVNAMEFKAVAVGTPPAGIEAFNKGACQIVAQDPEIIQPLDGDTLEAIQFDETPVTIKVQASYADMTSEDGYEIYVKYNPGDTEHASGAPSGFRKLDGTYKPGDGGTLERVDDGSGDLPKFIWDEVGEYETKFYIVAPVSKKKSCGTDASYRTVNANITPTKSVKVYTTKEITEFNEGESTALTLELSEDTKVDLYAFLKIESDDVSAEQFSSGSPYVIGMTNRNGKCLGIKIGRGKGSAKSPVSLPKLTFLDGYGPATGGYLGVDFTVVLASVQDYTEATNQNKIVKGYESDTLQLVINNLEPTVSYVMLGGFDSEKESGYEYTFKLPMGQEQTLQAAVKDPSNYDLDHEFACQWVISTSNDRKGPYTQRQKIETIGNPKDVVSKYNFPYKGWTRIALRVKDKDMDDWPDDAFETYVEVLDKPTITVEPLDEEPLEIDRTSIKFGLTYFDSPIPLVMKITVVPGNAGETGELVLDEQYLQAPAGYESHMAANTYFLTFSDDLPQDVNVVRMDGTMTSETSGFFLRTEILNQEVNPKTGDKWCDYYVPNSGKVSPYNVAPNKGDESVTFSPDSNPTSRWEIAGGSATTHPLTWRLKSDVQNDLDAGVKVRILGGGGKDFVCHEATNGTFIADFGSSQGDQEVTIQIEDKDGGQISRTWYFTIRASKFLTTVAHGPSDGTSTIKESNKYKTASGLGEGHVFAASPANFDSASDFRLKWNCSNEASAPVYAWGYKLANPIDNGSLDSHDKALDKSGSAKGTLEVTDPYVYTDDEGRDSFFYAWIMQQVEAAASTAQSGGSAGKPVYEVTISPEKNGAATVGTAKLPTAKAQGATANDTWPETEIEAVFAREYLWSDNMGDINFDRIPDLYFNKYEFTTEKESVNVSTGVSGTETAEVDDISPVTLYNDDKNDKDEVEGDFLPTAMLALMKEAKIPEEFTAEMEIRGFGPALNNAPQLAGVSGVKPEIRYTNPENDGLVASITNRSTLTKLEYEAWCDFAAANGITDPEDPASWYKNGQLVWSPERPSRPDRVDSDGDKFPDGYEYWYWYRAHVGYYDEAGNHVYQTGRRFNPRNPGRGDLITSAEIETMMDPLNPADISAKFADSDNDGIPDLLELKLGTDPFDFDSDNDGLPDGWEVVVSNTDPCGVVSDADANADGDAMAITSPELENLVLPLPLKIEKFQTFALFDPMGDSAGVQWYATLDPAEIALTEESEDMYVVKLASGEEYASRTFPSVSVNQTLARALNPVDTFLLKDGVVTMPAYLPAGVKVELAPATDGEKTPCTVKKLAAALDAQTTHACWIYGRDDAKDSSKAEFTTAAAAAGFLALGRNQEAPAEAQVCWLPSTDIDVAYLHYMVYQQFGFDPRTAWKPTDPTAARWSASDKGSGVYEGLSMKSQGGYAAFVTRTRPYTTYDEFLVMSFFLNNGTLDSAADASPTATNPWGTIWSKYTTNPRGPGQAEVAASDVPVTDEETDENEPAPVVAQDLSDNGADTDEDGVPDGWELYIMSGPKKEGAFVYAPPYAGFETSGGIAVKSYWSPFVAEAKSTATDNQLNIGTSATDGLTQFREFGGTDTIAYYTSVSSNQTAAATIVRADEDAKWINKFFPTDPWSSDTDGDGVKDSAEGTSFVYGTPADDGRIWSVPGGGLNPCAIDTDLDGLPDFWEQQFKGSKVYDGEDADYVTVGGEKVGNPLQGYVDGMDGTVMDAYTVAKVRSGVNTATEHTWYSVDGRILSGKVNRDYDHDGLENWQEYLTGTMRCWRYDDPYSRWEPIPREYYWDEGGNWAPNFEALGVADEAEFWAKTLYDVTSEIYNPHLVTGQNGGQYLSRVTNGWDLAYIDEVLDSSRAGGAYYWLYNRIGATTVAELWAEAIGNENFKGPKKYACCSPINPDSDQDGMDDYYELFHGMNPLLGASGVIALEAVAPCDLIAEAYAASGNAVVIQAWGDNANYWMTPAGLEKRQPRGTGYDFVAFPWLNGIATADPDGDDIRNQQEAIMPMLATETWQHSDPTPLWMTDSSYSNSLVNQYFALPVRYGEATIGLESPVFTVGEGEDATTYDLRDADGYLPPIPGLLPTPARFGAFLPDFWMLAAADKPNWMYSFEENEGFDTDHDALNDADEATGKFANEDSDPLDADGPRRRQAMWFPGENAVLQTMPEIIENYPAALYVYPQDPSFMQFTVECWVKADESMLGTGADDQYVMVERPVWTDLSKCADEEYIRRNFQLSISQGKWCAMYEPSGTLLNTQVRVLSKFPATTDWTHVAATYDGREFVLYINGERAASREVTVQPEYGASARVCSADDTGSWAGNLQRTYPYYAILVGASLKSNNEFGSVLVGLALDLTQGCGWDYYTRFFKGYIDEVRIWDGARTAEEVRRTKGVRADRKFAEENRSEFYAQWAKIAPAYAQYPQGCRRYVKDINGNDCVVPAELRYHFSFDSVPSAQNAEMVAKAPRGFDSPAARWSRPGLTGEDWEIAWWKRVLDGYAGSVYSNPQWVTWVPNTIAHLPRLDGTTLDSVFWSKDFRGNESGRYTFANSAEPVSLWTQVAFNGATEAGYYQSTGSRLWESVTSSNTNFDVLFDFTGRHLFQSGADLVPLGGAFAKYTDAETGFWDGQGPSSYSEVTGDDADYNGLPDWWEEYAADKHQATPPIGWDTIVNYEGGGVQMTARQAYFRDMAKGYYADSTGKIVTDAGIAYRQVGDSQSAGVPDWWMRTYGILGESALDDHDNDGLSNYTEYMLSEVFNFGKLFDPTEPRSIDPHTLDYFFKIGELYAGEIFTDHDLVEDAWEDQYDEAFASRVKYDPDADADGDGWSNRSEARYTSLVSPIVANQISHYTVTDGLTPDHPIPTLEMTIRYNGENQSGVDAAPMVVQVSSDPSLLRTPDAVYTIGTQDSTTSDGSQVKYKVLGKWSDRRAVGTLTPGYVNAASLGFEFIADPSAVTYRWTVGDGSAVFSGPRSAYDEAIRTYGAGRVNQLDKVVEYSTLELEQQTSAESESITWIIQSSGKTLGTVNLTTGEYILDIGALKDVQAYPSGVDAATVVSMEDQSFRIRYEVNPAVNLPRKLYLGDADEGYVREGANTVVAWAETIAVNGIWEPGEPFGVATDVNIGWRTCAVSLDLTDTHPAFARVYLTALAENDRDYWYGLASGNTTNTVPASFSGGQKEYVRVVRYAIDGQTSKNGISPAILNKVVLEKTFDLGVRNFLHEGDFISAVAPDIDWNDLMTDILNDPRAKTLEVTNVTYRVVLGTGPIATAVEHNALRYDIHRTYDIERQIPNAIAPGLRSDDIVKTPNPTFKWRLNGLVNGRASSYTAFKIVVTDSSGKREVWNSGLRQLPPVDKDGNYVWASSLYVDDIDTAGHVFTNNTRYSWKVAMYNSKFNWDEFSPEKAVFLMSVPTNSVDYGNANVAVKYYGPKESYKGKVIRVRAFTSPDFSGIPVASGYVASPNDKDTGVGVTGKVIRANCRLIGIPRGTYYLQAFIDSNANGVCDSWESMGYVIDSNKRNIHRYDPMPVTFDQDRGVGDLLPIYIEDADTDNDGLPDAWEYAKFKSLSTKGAESVALAPAGEIAVNKDLTGQLSLQENAVTPSSSLAARAGEMIGNAGLLALALGAPIDSDTTSFASAISASISEELVEQGVRIVSLGFDVSGAVCLEVEAEVATGAGSDSVMNRVIGSGDGVLKVSCQLYRATDLAAGDWKPVGEQQIIEVGKNPASVKIENAAAGAASSFFKVVLEEK